MNTKFIVPTVLIAGLSLAVAGTYAATTTSSSGTSSAKTSFGQKGFFSHGMGPFAEMTDAEKTAFEAMSDTEKKTYIETKRKEAEAKRDAREAIIDKLLVGTSLSVDEEVLRQEIIKERAEMKVKKAEMDAKRDQIKAIIEKKQAGTALTTEEQALLDSMPKMGGKGGRGGPMHRGE